MVSISHDNKQHGINITRQQAVCYQYHTPTSSMVSIYHTTASSMVSISHDNKQHGINITPQQAAWYQYHTTTSSMLSISHANKQHGTNISHHSKQHGINITPYQAACYQYHTITSSTVPIPLPPKKKNIAAETAHATAHKNHQSIATGPSLSSLPLSHPPPGVFYTR